MLTRREVYNHFALLALLSAPAIADWGNHDTDTHRVVLVRYTNWDFPPEILPLMPLPPVEFRRDGVEVHIARKANDNSFQPPPDAFRIVLVYVADVRRFSVTAFAPASIGVGGETWSRVVVMVPYETLGRVVPATVHVEDWNWERAEAQESVSIKHAPINDHRPSVKAGDCLMSFIGFLAPQGCLLRATDVTPRIRR